MNTAPVVSAGPDQSLAQPGIVTLSGSVQDDGLPAGGTLRTAWSFVSGSGEVTLGSPGQAITTARFNYPGSYLLRLTASDSELITSADVHILVGAPAGAAPLVALSAPLDGAQVTSPTAIVGSVSGGSWKLEALREGAPGRAIAQGVGAMNGTLATFDPTQLLNGTDLAPES